MFFFAWKNYEKSALQNVHTHSYSALTVAYFFHKSLRETAYSAG